MVNIKSNLKKPSHKGYDKDAHFEQRASTLADRDNYYLHQPTKLVPISEEGLEIVNYFVPKMKSSIEGCGIGLAHPQLPSENNATNPYAIFVIHCESDDIPFEAFINPVIVGFSLQSTSFPHGCLSAIDYPRGEMKSFKDILIAYYPEELDKIIVKKFTGFAAIIVQHELTHILQNETYIDVVTKYFDENEQEIQSYFAASNEAYTALKDTDTEGAATVSHDSINKLDDQKDVPFLISKQTLAKCKNFLLANKPYSEAVGEYLSQHPEEQFLYDSLFSIKSSDSPIYSNLGEISEA